MKNVESFYKTNERYVKSLMALQGLTFAMLAERVNALARANYSLGALHHVVRGRRSGKNLLPLIAQALGVDVSDITFPCPSSDEEKA